MLANALLAISNNGYVVAKTELSNTSSRLGWYTLTLVKGDVKKYMYILSDTDILIGEAICKGVLDINAALA